MIGTFQKIEMHYSISLFRNLPTARENDAKTSTGKGKGPKVMTGNDDGAQNLIFDSFRKSICSKERKIE